MRDDVLDTGIAMPGPSGVEHPFNAGETIYWYQSPDIKIDAPDPVTGAYQTPSRDIDYVQFEELVHDNPRRDTWVRAHVQIHNRGNNDATNVQVRAFWANAGGGLPDLPVDFWTAFPTRTPRTRRCGTLWDRPDPWARSIQASRRSRHGAGWFPRRRPATRACSPRFDPTRTASRRRLS